MFGIGTWELLLILVLGLSLAVPAVADTSVKQLVSKEKRALGSIPASQLDTLLQRPKSAGPITYSRSFLEAQPKAKLNNRRHLSSH